MNNEPREFGVIYEEVRLSNLDMLKVWFLNVWDVFFTIPSRTTTNRVVIDPHDPRYEDSFKVDMLSISRYTYCPCPNEKPEGGKQ